MLFASALVGFLAEGWGDRWGDFNWEVAAIAGTALGTTALAGFTGALAFTTSGDVRATWELADLTRKQQAAQERPIVIAKYVRSQNGPAGAARVEVGLANVGLGPALRLELMIEHEYTANFAARAWRSVLRPGEDIVVTMDVRLPDPGVPREEGFRLTKGAYLDRSRENEYEIITDWDSPVE